MRFSMELDTKEQARLGMNARKKIVADADWNTEMLKAEKIYEELVG